MALVETTAKLPPEWPKMAQNGQISKCSKKTFRYHNKNYERKGIGIGIGIGYYTAVNYSLAPSNCVLDFPSYTLRAPLDEMHVLHLSIDVAATPPGRAKVRLQSEVHVVGTAQ